MPDTTTDISPPLNLDAIRARAKAAPTKLRTEETLDDETDQTWLLILDPAGEEYAAVSVEMRDFADWIIRAAQDIHSTAAEVKRLRKVVEILGRNLQGSARAVTDVVVGAGIQREEMSRYLTDLVLAAENVEAEADAENRSSQSLAAMRRVLNTIPADALTLNKTGESAL